MNKADSENTLKAKPLTILVNEFTQKTITQINTSQLPPIIIESILKNLLQEVHTASQKELEILKKEYELATKE